MQKLDMSVTLQAARDYVANGFSVIPVLPHGKKPAFSWKEYQQRLPHDEELVGWFGNGTQYNIGIVTGDVSGLAVVDLDSGQAVAFAKDHNIQPSPMVKTGRGFHVYYKTKDGIRNFQQRDDLPDIDLRAEGGYVVAPPSVHESGRSYEWVKGRELGEVEMAELPAWVLAEKPEEKRAVKELYHGVENGGRNKALARLVGSWINDGGSLEEIIEQAQVWNTGNSNPLPSGEVERTVQSISERHHDWPEPQPITMDLYKVHPLPMEILPIPFQSWIKDVAHRMQCPPDYVAMAALTLTGSIIGTRCGIRPKQNDDWLVIPNLWGGVVGPPSSLKSPAISEGLKPLARLEAEAQRKFENEENKFQVDLIEYQANRKRLETEVGKVASGKGKRSMDSIKNELLELEEPDKPTKARYKTNDSTIEKLSELLNENPAGLLMFRDELVGLLASWDKPGRESDRAFYLESWNGDLSHDTDRIGRGSTHTEHLCLSLFGGIQPQKLISYLYKSMNGYENDGFCQRLQMMVYPDSIKGWEFVDKAPNRDARDRAYRVIEKLAHMDFTKYGASQGEFDRFPYLHFADEAQVVFNEWVTELEVKKLRADDHPLILEHFGKYRSLMPSLALIFHLIDIADGASCGPVSLQAVNKATALCEYFESHARRIYGLVVDIDQQAAEALAKKIRAGKLTDGFTARNVYRKHWQSLDSTELAQAACDELVELGWLRVTPQSDGIGRQPLPAHRINPMVKIADKSKN